MIFRVCTILALVVIVNVIFVSVDLWMMNKVSRCRPITSDKRMSEDSCFTGKLKRSEDWMNIKNSLFLFPSRDMVSAYKFEFGSHP